MRNLNRCTLLNSLLFCVFAAPVLAEENDWLSQAYITGNIGLADSHVSIGEVRTEFDKAGITNTTINDVDSRRTGYGIGLGYDITPNWAVELAYLDLGQVDVDFTSTQAIDLTDVHPESGDGFTLSVLYKYMLDVKTHVRLRFGAFGWRADYDTTQGNGSASGKDSDSGTDLYWGAGLGHQVTEQITLIGEIQSFNFDRDDTTYLSIGAEWHFR